MTTRDEVDEGIGAVCRDCGLPVGSYEDRQSDLWDMRRDKCYAKVANTYGGYGLPGCRNRTIARLRREIDGKSALAADNGYSLGQMRHLLDGFEDEIERASQHLQSKGGQQVSFMGDFARCPPSTLNRLRWWLKAFRDALASAEPGREDGGEASTTNVTIDDGVRRVATTKTSGSVTVRTTTRKP